MSYVPVLILAHADDRLALRVYAALRARHGPEVAKIVSDEELVFAPHWCHHINGEHVGTEIELTDGTRLESDKIGVVLNRLRSVDKKHFAGSPDVDLRYAVMETHALWLSWLASLPCPVINPATPRGLSAPERGEAEWMLLAGVAGLPTRGWQLSTNTRRFSNRDYVAQSVSSGFRKTEDDGDRSPLTVGRAPSLFLEPVEDGPCVVNLAGERVVGPLAGVWDQQLLALGKASGCALLEVVFALKKEGVRSDP